MLKNKKKKGRGHYRTAASYRGKTEESRARQVSGLKGVNRTNWRIRHLKAAGLSKAAKYPDQYPKNIIHFIEQHFYIKNTGKVIVLLDWQRKVLHDIFYASIRPSLAICGSVKKSGKSALASAVCEFFLTNVKMSENYILAPDQDAGRDIIFSGLKQSIRMHPILREKCKITRDLITYDESFVKVLSNDISVAGLRPNLTCIDEIYLFRDESSIRTLDEMTTNPVGNHLTFVTTLAGFTEDCNENLHLWRWYQRGKAIQEGREEPDPQFYFHWKEDYKNVPWVEGTNYLKHQRKILRPGTFQRFHENKWASAIETFITSDVYDACVDTKLRPGAEQRTEVVVAIDASTKWDASALVCLAKDPTKKRGLVLIEHQIFEPKGKTINFERTIEATLIRWNNLYKIRQCYFDPYQMLRTSQSLAADYRIPMIEYTQSVQNMVTATQSLSELLYSGNLRLYKSNQLRTHILSASTKEHSVGCRLVKKGSGKKIDAAIALCMAVEAGMHTFLLKGKKGSVYDPSTDAASDDFDAGAAMLEERVKMAMGN